MQRANQTIAASAILLGLFIGFSCAPTPQTEKNKIAVQRAWDEVINQGNLEAAEELFTADYVYHSAGNPDLHGLEQGVRRPVTIQRTAFPDIHCKVEDMIAEGDLVVHRWSAAGTHRGEFMGIPPTGKRVAMTGIVFSRMVDGKTAEDWSEMDELGMLQQLGAIPPMGRKDFTWGKPMEPVTDTPSDPEKNKAVYLREVEMWKTRNPDMANEIFATNFVNHDPIWPSVTNLESFKQWNAKWIADAPDMELDMEAIVAEGDMVAGRWTSRWTDIAGAAGNPLTGKQITVTGMDICRFANGKIVERWWAKDGLSAMKQLDVIPPPEESEE